MTKRKIYGEMDNWDKEWIKYNVEETLAWNKSHDEFKYFDKYISKNDMILEAGCGLGRLVIHFKRRGYDIIGVDSSEIAIKKIKEYDPLMPVKLSDIRSLPFKDECFDVYISIGVIEHYEEGPEKIISEANRIIKKGGKIIIDIPISNLLNTMLYPFSVIYHASLIENCIRIFFGKRPSKREHFENYLYSKEEFEDMIIKAGFKIIASDPIQYRPGLVNSLPFLLNRKEDRDPSGNSDRYLNQYGRFIFNKFSFLRWMYPLCHIIVAKK